MESALTVLILDDHEIVASTLAAITKDILAGVKVVTAGSFTRGVSLLQQGLVADLVILDVNLPGGELYGMVPILRAIQPGVRILIFTGSEQYAVALQFLNAGANGYLTKTHAMEEIGVAILTILSGQKYISEDMKQIVSDNIYKVFKPAGMPGTIDLSPREKEVLALLLDGKHTKQISAELNLKITTVSAHKARIFEKLQVSNVIDLFKRVKLSL